MQEQTVRHEHYHSEPAPDLRIKVERGQRGGYGWEISASAPGHDIGTLIEVIRNADNRLRAEYGPVEDDTRRAA